MIDKSENSTMVYLLSFIIANSTTSYVLSKINEPKIIKCVNGIQTNSINDIYEHIAIPQELVKLVSVMEQKIPKYNLKNLYNNLRNVTVRKNFMMLLLGIKGKYNSEKNTLEYTIDGSKEHEIVHLASANYDKNSNICQSGFVNYDKHLTCGKAINEGYTDLTARRLFNKKTAFYNGEVRIVHFIELLLDKDKMQEYYFNNNLVSFINDFSHFFSSREEAIKFILSFDRAFILKQQGNPIYKIIYTNLELKLCQLFEEYNKSLLKQIDYLNLLDQSLISGTIQKIKR